jgi:hypothetical protein
MNTTAGMFFVLFLIIITSLIIFLGILRLEKHLYEFVSRLYINHINGRIRETILISVIVVGCGVLALNYFCYISGGIMGSDNTCYSIKNASDDLFLSVDNGERSGYIDTSKISSSLWSNNIK